MAEDPRPAAGPGALPSTLGGADPRVLLTLALDAAVPDPGPRFAPPTAAELEHAFPGLVVHELLGLGGMGAVYRATQERLERPVALKILPPHRAADQAWVARFQREAKALARLSHPHLVTIHDVGCAGPWNYLVMEFVDGANLRQVLAAGRLGPAEVLALVPQLCDALQYAHDHGVVHRDLKPENILIDGRGRARIADFGLAKLLDRQDDLPSLTASGATMGTLHYMAPEQIEGAKGVDHRADIYALGVVLYEMLTGGLPLGRFDPPSRRIAVDARVDLVVLRSLEKDPARRWQKASELQAGLARVVADPTGATPGGAPRPPRILAWWVLAGCLLLALAALQAIGKGPGPERALGLVGVALAPVAAWAGWCLRTPRARSVLRHGAAAWGVLALLILGASPPHGLLLLAGTGLAAWPLRGRRWERFLAAVDDEPAPWPVGFRVAAGVLWVLAGLTLLGHRG